MVKALGCGAEGCGLKLQQEPPGNLLPQIAPKYSNQNT